MFLASRVDRILKIPARKFKNLTEIYLEMKADQPYKIPDKIGHAYIRDYSEVFYMVPADEAPKVAETAKKVAKVKAKEEKKTPKFDVIKFLNDYSLEPEEKLRDKLAQLGDLQIIEVSKALKLRLPINTGRARRIDRIVSDIKIRNSAEIKE